MTVKLNTLAKCVHKVKLMINNKSIIIRLIGLVVIFIYGCSYNQGIDMRTGKMVSHKQALESYKEYCETAFDENGELK